MIRTTQECRSIYEKYLSGSVKLVYSKWGEVDSAGAPYFTEAFFSSLKESLGTQIILYFQPLTFHHPPERFSYIQMRRVRRQIKDIQVALLPLLQVFEHLIRLVYPGIVQHQHSRFSQCLAKSLQLLKDKLPIDGF